VLLEKLTGSQLVKKFAHFMEPEGLLPHAQVPATCPYSEPDQSSHCPPSHYLKIRLILSPHLRLGLQSGLFPSGFPTKPLYTRLLSPYVLRVPPIAFFSI